MPEKTAIAWCDSSLSLWVGCTQLSPACDHCYAKAIAEHFKMVAWNGPPIKTVDKTWDQIERYQRGAKRFITKHGHRRRVFINSMADFFDNRAHDGWRMAACARMQAAPDVVWILVTKRPQNVLKMVPRGWLNGGWPQNVWLITTVENRVEADRRIPVLIDTAKIAGIRTIGLSMEPLLEFVYISRERLACLNWLIFGGESGRGARQMSEEWAISLLSGAMEIERRDGNPRPAVFVKQMSQRGARDKTFKDFASFPPALQVREFPDA